MKRKIDEVTCPGIDYFSFLPNEIIKLILEFVGTFRSIRPLRALNTLFKNVIDLLRERATVGSNLYNHTHYEIGHKFSVLRRPQTSSSWLSQNTNPPFCLGNGIGAYHHNATVRLVDVSYRNCFLGREIATTIGNRVTIINNTLVIFGEYPRLSIQWEENNLSMRKEGRRCEINLTSSSINGSRFANFWGFIKSERDYCSSDGECVFLFEETFLCVSFASKIISTGKFRVENAPQLKLDLRSSNECIEFGEIFSVQRIGDKSCLVSTEKGTVCFYEKDDCVKKVVIFEKIHCVWKNLVVILEYCHANLYSFEIECVSGEDGTETIRAKKTFIKTLLEFSLRNYFDLRHVTLSEFGVALRTDEKEFFYFFVGQKPPGRDGGCVSNKVNIIREF